MRRYTTPTIELTVEGHDLTASDVYVTMRQQGRELTIEDADVALDGGDTVITFALTQEQSATFREGRARVEVNWVDADGFRNATSIEELAVTPNLLNRVIEHDG